MVLQPLIDDGEAETAQQALGGKVVGVRLDFGQCEELILEEAEQLGEQEAGQSLTAQLREHLDVEDADRVRPQRVEKDREPRPDEGPRPDRRPFRRGIPEGPPAR